MSSNLGFFLREAFGGIRANLLMSLTATVTTFICAVALGGALLFGAHVKGLVESLQRGVTIDAFFPQGVSKQKMEDVRRTVAGYPEVEKVRLVTKKEAYERFKKRFSDNPRVYRGLGSDFLPASLEITLKKSSAAPGVAARLKSEGFSSSDLSYPQQTVRRLDRVAGYVIWALRLTTGLFLLASVLLVSNAIRLSIFARRKEIEVMKLVGASDGFVRTPFVIEGLLQSLTGAVIGAVVVLLANRAFVGWSHHALPFFPISAGYVDPLQVLGVVVGFGCIIGAAGSYLSVRRFLKV